MWPSAELSKIDGLAILVDGSRLAVSLVVSEAIFDAYDDPVMDVRVSCLIHASGKPRLRHG